MSHGVIFDIKEMSVHDGPGMRVTVFFKGCPLRCMWCHNPEGFLSAPQVMFSHQGCKSCGKCEWQCSHPECEGFGVCTKICPNGLIRVVGETVNSVELATRLKKYAPAFDFSGGAAISGGVTISGGEPLMQPDFLLDLLNELKPVHTVLETSGHGDTNVFRQAVELSELVFFDIKLLDPEKHRIYTGVDNRLILRNLDALKSSSKHFTIRMPIIPGVNATQEHFAKAGELLRDVKDRVNIEILPYNPLAGAKYASVGLEFRPIYTEGSTEFYADVLESEGLAVRIL